MLELKPAELWEMSWPEFWMLYHGWQVRHQYALEPARIVAAYLINTSMGAPKTAVLPRQVFPLSEIDGKPKKVDPAEIEAFAQRISKRLGREIKFVTAAA